MVPPYARRFPDFVVEHYEGEDTPLKELLELWVWKWDLARHTPMGPIPDETKMALRLGKEVEDFFEIEENSRVALEEAELKLLLVKLGDAALDWREASEMQESES
jgi:hypothetical protein